MLLNGKAAQKLTAATLQNVKTEQKSNSPTGTERHFIHVQWDIKNNYVED